MRELTPMMVNGRLLQGEWRTHRGDELHIVFESNADTWEFLYRIILRNDEHVVRIGRLVFRVILEKLDRLEAGEQQSVWRMTEEPLAIGA